MSKPHSTCRQVLIDEMRLMGVEITVSTAPPIVAGPYTTDAHRCPHGVDFWIEQTGEQIAQWVKDGVR
jgi:hypothetical protein